jgi:hypothetical protein
MKQTFTFLMGLLFSTVMWSQDYVIENGVLTSWINPPEEITIPAEATSIASSVFQNNTTIKVVNTNEVTEVGEFAFDYCTSLTEINMPKVTKIGQRAFRGCYALAKLDMPEVVSIKDVAFHACNGLTEVVLPASLTEFGGGALSNCAKLTTITVSEGNTSFVAEGGVLYNATKTKIWAYAKGLTATSYVAPPSVTAVGGLAFWGNTSLTTVSLPEVTAIADRAFFDCIKLTSISMPKVITIDYQTFYNCNAIAGTFVLPDGLKTCIGSVFNKCYKITAFEISTSNDYFKVSDGVLFSKDMKKLVAYPPGKVGDTYVLPASVEVVGNSAFCENKTLKVIDAVSTNLKTLEYAAFQSSLLLETLKLPSSLVTIGDQAFAYCPKLTNITIEGLNPNYVIEDGVIFNTNKTKLILYPKSKAETSYTVPSTVTEIGNSAFLNCTALTQVILPNVVNVGTRSFEACTNLLSIDMPNVTTLGTYAFNGCSKLTNVSMPKVTRINSYAFYNCIALKTLSLPEIKSIYASAFDFCSGLISVDCSLARSLNYLGVKPFMPANTLLTVKVASSVVKSSFPSEFSRKYQVVVQTYDVSVAVAGSNGTVVATVDGQPFTSGALTIDKLVELTATPVHNYAIEKWTVNGVVQTGNIETNWNYTVKSDATIEVFFVEKPDALQTYALSYSVAENSLLTDDGGTLLCEVDGSSVASGNLVLFNKEALFTASPGIGYRVNSWLVNDLVVEGNTTNTYTHRIPKAASTVKVVYEVNAYALNYSVVLDGEEGEGHGTLIAEVDNHLILTGNEVAHNKNIVFTATPDVGYKLKQWTVDGVVQNEYGHSLSIGNYAKSTVVTVEFEAKTYQVSFSVDGSNGTLSAKNGAVTLATPSAVAHGSNLLFTALPDDGYRLKQWKLNDVLVGNNNLTYAIDNLTEAATVSVEFEAIPFYSVTYSVVNSEGGQLFASVNGSPIASGASLIEGTQIDFTAQPDAGYEIKTWNDNGQAVSAFTTYPVVINKNEDVTIEFNKKTFILTYVAGENGSITGETTQLVLYGGSGTQVLAVPDQGYRFVKWCDGVTDNPRTDANVTNNLILDCEFALSTDVENNASMQVEVYPNPFVDQLNVNNATDIVKYSLLNAAGQVELQGVNNGSTVIVIPVQTIKSGMIVLMLQTTDGKQTYHKLMKK